jgi:hypothetical protein
MLPFRHIGKKFDLARKSRECLLTFLSAGFSNTMANL